MIDRQMFCVVDPHLKDMMGHYFMYDYSLMEAARGRGFEFLVLGHKRVDPLVADVMPVRKVFSREIWQAFPRMRLVPRVGRQMDTLCSNLLFYWQLRRALRTSELTPESVVFSHMITTKQLLAWAWWFRILPQKRAPRLVLLFRYSADWFEGSQVTTRAFRLLEKAANGSRIRICTDSERLSRDYAQFTRLPIDTVPIPHTQHSVIPGDGSPRLRGAMCLASLGNARDEKGFLEILGAIKLLYEAKQLDRFKFILQANHASFEIQSAIQEIEDLNVESVEFARETLSPDEYYRMLTKADAILLPYWRSIYRSRTSGIFVEALAAGKPVIVTEDTWMSDQLGRYGGGLLCRDRDARHLRDKILELDGQYDYCAKRAATTRQAWLEKHNPDAFMEALLMPSKAPGTPTKIAVLYPWGDIGDRRSGAGKRAGLLVDYLSERYPYVRVVHGGSWPSGKRGNVKYISSQISRLTRTILNLGAALCRVMLAVVTLGESRGEEFMFWIHHSHRFEPSLRRRVTEVARWADVVLLEYTFWARSVVRACRRENVRVILTDYDVVSGQINRSLLLRKWAENLEMGALKSADYAVCVSVTDCQTFKEHGVDARVIPHPIDAQKINRRKHEFKREKEAICKRLESVHKVQLPRQNVCLFVGSYFGANLVAVERIREFARALLPGVGQAASHFIVAGMCCPPGQDRNFIALGTVDEEALKDLYILTDVVVLPLPFGTGASLKTIEAMADGKAIVGTRVAFRGYPVITGVNCIISDDMAAYPEIILDLLKNPVKRQELGENARAFAELYNYRIVYQEYAELIEGPQEERGLGPKLTKMFLRSRRAPRSSRPARGAP